MRALRTGDRFGYSIDMAKLTHTLVAKPAIRKEFLRLAGFFPWSRVDLADFPAQMWICFGETAEGRAVITGLVLSPGTNREISARALRDIPLSRLLLLQKVGLTAGKVKKSEPYRPVQARPGPKGWPREHFTKVAEAYRHALKTHPRTPIRYLSVQQFKVSEATVHRWLQRARDMGMLQ